MTFSSRSSDSAVALAHYGAAVIAGTSFVVFGVALSACDSSAHAERRDGATEEADDTADSVREESEGIGGQGGASASEGAGGVVVEDEFDFSGSSATQDEHLAWGSYRSREGEAGGFLLRSPDGGTWSLVEKTYGAWISSAAHSGERWLVVGTERDPATSTEKCFIRTSDDGLDWVAAPAPTDPYCHFVSWTGSSFLISTRDDDGEVSLWRHDGVAASVQLVSSSSTLVPFSPILATENVLLGYTANAILSSVDDGGSWNSVGQTGVYETQTLWRESSGYFATALQFFRPPSEPFPPSPALFFSEGGTDFAAVNSPAAPYLEEVAQNSVGWIGVKRGTPAQSLAFRASDQETWQDVDGAVFDFWPRGISAGVNFVALGAANIYWSANGTDWSASAVPNLFEE